MHGGLPDPCLGERLAIPPEFTFHRFRALGYLEELRHAVLSGHPGVDASPVARRSRLLGGSGTRCARQGESRSRLTADPVPCSSPTAGSRFGCVRRAFPLCDAATPSRNDRQGRSRPSAHQGSACGLCQPRLDPCGIDAAVSPEFRALSATRIGAGEMSVVARMEVSALLPRARRRSLPRAAQRS